MNNKKFKKYGAIFFGYLLSLMINFSMLYFLNSVLKSDTEKIKNVLTQQNKKTNDINTNVKIISKKEVEALKEKYQIITNDLTGKNEVPKNSKYIGEKNQVFEKETIAIKKTANNTTPLAQSLTASAKEQSSQKKTEKLIEKKNKVKSNLKLSDLGSLNLGLGSSKNQEAKEESAENKKNNSREVGSNSNDFVENVPLSNLTNLNSSEFKYYGYFERLKRKMEEHWFNLVQLKINKLRREGKKLGVGNVYKTLLQITINDKGDIIDLKVLESGGVFDLDQAGVDSFNRASPFLNPPKGLVENGKYTFNFEFIIH